MKVIKSTVTIIILVLLLCQGFVSHAQQKEPIKNNIKYYTASLSGTPYNGQFHIVSEETKDGVTLLVKNVNSKEINYYEVNDTCIKKYDASKQLVHTINKRTDTLDYLIFKKHFMLNEVISKGDSLSLNLLANKNNSIEKDTSFNTPFADGNFKFTINARLVLKVNKSTNQFYFHKIIKNNFSPTEKHEVEYNLLKTKTDTANLDIDMLDDAVFDR